MPVCLSVHGNKSAHSARIFMKFDIVVFFDNLSRKFQFNYSFTRKTCTLHEGL